MSTTSPLEPHLPPAEPGIPAADAGHGAPPPADGFGVAGEEPDRPEQTDEESPATGRGATPFRTPDPTGLGPDH